MPFQPATKKQAFLRLAFVGPAGAGKTMTALKTAKALSDRIAVIDTERGSASKYAGLVADFDVLELDDFHPQKYIDAIREAERARYPVIVIDSLSHAWSGKGGVLEVVDKAAQRSGRGDKFSGWREGSPLQNALFDTILSARAHVIATMRAKMDYALERNPSTGRNEVIRVGLKPVQRDESEYEFDVVGMVDQDHRVTITKTRCPALEDAVFERPDDQIAVILKDWLTDGAPMPMTLNELVDRYGTEAVMEAAGGTLPATPDALRAVTRALQEVSGAVA